MNSSISVRHSAIATAVPTGHMSHTTDVDFSGTAVKIPAAIKYSQPEPLSEGINPLVSKKNTAGPYQEATTWTADKKSIVIIKGRRALKHKGGKTYSPAGPWVKHSVDERFCLGKPSYMHGEIPELPSKENLGSSSEMSPELTHGIFISSFLPTVVQKYLTDTVSLPHYVLGNMWSYTDGIDSIVTHQEIELIRVGENKAIVIKARRNNDYKGPDTVQAINAIDNKYWTVQQFTFNLQNRHTLPYSKANSLEDYISSL